MRSEAIPKPLTVIGILLRFARHDGFIESTRNSSKSVRVYRFEGRPPAPTAVARDSGVCVLPYRPPRQSSKYCQYLRTMVMSLTKLFFPVLLCASYGTRHERPRHVQVPDLCRRRLAELHAGAFQPCRTLSCTPAGSAPDRRSSTCLKTRSARWRMASS